jgi:autotransporter-associated beta strand protein
MKKTVMNYIKNHNQRISFFFTFLCFLSLNFQLKAQTTIAQWTFEADTISTSTSNSPILTAGSLSTADIGALTTNSSFTAYHSNASTVWTIPTTYGSFSKQSLLVDHWSDNDYFQFKLSTLAFSGISITWDQRGSNTGPQNFKLQYSVDGQNFSDVPISIINYTYSVANETWGDNIALTTASRRTANLSSLTTLNNRDSVFFRITQVAGTVSVVGGPIGSSGTSNVDNFTVTGSSLNYYWNGASSTTPGTTGVTAYGGDGNWGTTGAWVTPTNPGTAANWTDNVNAIFGGTGDNVVLDANRTALSCQFNVDGYALSTNAVGPINLVSSIILANNSNLTLNPNLNLATPSSGRMGIGSVNGSGSSSINLQTARSVIPIATRVDLTSGAQINVPTIIYAAGTVGDSSLVGYCASAATDVFINGDITNNSIARTLIGTSSDVSSNITVNGKITGTAGLQFSAGVSGGKGIVLLKAKNNYLGSTYFNAASTNATIKMGIDSALPFTTKVKMGLSTSNGGIWDLNGYNQFISSLTNGTGGGYITNNGVNDATLTVSGSDNPGDFSLAINDGTKKISIVRAGTGTLSLTNANNTYSGSTTINGGVLSISNDRNIGAVPASATAGKIKLNGGKLSLIGSFDINANRGIVLDGTYDTIEVAQGKTSTYAGIVAGAGNITKSGLGNLTLNGDNTYTGTTTIAGGSLTFIRDANFGAVPVSYTSNMINLNGGKLIDNAVNFYDTIHANRGINLVASTSDTIEVNSTSLVYGGKITGSGNLVKTGNGVLILSGSSDFTGSITINKGAIQLNNTNTLTANNNVIINNSGSQLSVNAKQSLNDITINSGGELYVANNLDTLTVSGTCRNNGGTINANGSVLKFTSLENNSGTINANFLPGSFSTINIFGSLNMNNGSINIYNSDTLNIKPNASFTMSSGSFNISNLATLTIDSLVTATISGGAFIIADGGIFNERSALPQASTYTLDNNGTVNVGPSNTTQYFPGTGVTISNIDSLIINNSTSKGGVLLNKNISNLTTLLKITSGCTFDAQAYTLAGPANLFLAGTSSNLRLAKNDVTLPELTGAYNTSTGNGGTIVFYGTGTQTLRANDYNNFSSADTTYSHNIVFPSNASIGINGNFTPSLRNTTYTVGTGNTFIYKGGSQIIRDFPYYSLVLAGTSTKTVDTVNLYTLSNGVSVIDSLKIGTALTLNMYGNSGFPATSKARNITLKSSATKTARIYIAPGTTTNIGYGSGSTLTNYTTGPYGFILERYVPAKKAWRLMANPLKDTTFQFGNSGVYYKPLSFSISSCWQEGQSTNGNSPASFTSGLGTIITNGTSQSNGFDQGPNSSSSIKYYDSSLNTWTAISSTNSKITDHPGYLLYVRGDRNIAATSGSTPNNTVLRSRGVIARGKQTANFTYTNNASDTRYRLVGNPYPSAINFSTVTKTNVADNYYLWDPELGGANGVGAYVSFSRNGNSYYKSPATSTLPTDGTIESGAAFFVQFSTNSGSLTFYETDKVASSSSTAFGRSNDQSKKLILNLNGVNPDGTVYPADGVLLSFAANQNNDVDVNDMKKISNFSENLGVAKGADLLAIERRNEIESHDTIYLKTTSLKQKTYQLECIPQNLTSNLECYIEDNYTNINTPLSLTDTSRYSFTINTDAGSYSADRFKIIFRPSATLPVKIVSFSATKKSSNIELNWRVENEINIKQYVIEHSENGYKFETINSLAPKGNHLSIENYQAVDATPSPLNNYYRIKAINIDGSIVYSEIVSLLEKNTTQELTVYPNPVKNGVINILLSDKIQGKATIHILNAAGQLAYSDFIKASSSKEIKINHLPTGAYQLIVKDESGKTWVEKIVKY